MTIEKSLESAQSELATTQTALEESLNQVTALQEQLFAVIESQKEQNKFQRSLDWTTHLANLSLLVGLTEDRMHDMSIETLVLLLGTLLYCVFSLLF